VSAQIKGRPGTFAPAKNGKHYDVTKRMSCHMILTNTIAALFAWKDMTIPSLGRILLLSVPGGGHLCLAR